jgi:hypothetical protein
VPPGAVSGLYDPARVRWQLAAGVWGESGSAGSRPKRAAAGPGWSEYGRARGHAQQSLAADDYRQDGEPTRGPLASRGAPAARLAFAGAANFAGAPTFADAPAAAHLQRPAAARPVAG